MSLADNQYGPVYIFGNVVWQQGRIEVAGRANLPAHRGVRALIFKTSSQNGPPPRVYVVNNTFASDQSDLGPAPGAADNGGYGDGSTTAVENTNGGSLAQGGHPYHYWRNNIIVFTGANYTPVSDTVGPRIGWSNSSIPADRYDEDYNILIARNGHHVNNPGRLYTSITQYRFETGLGANTNDFDGNVDFTDVAAGLALFTDFDTGNLSLAALSGALGQGVAIAGVVSGTPDLGYEGAS
jgi:hypothetical protein